MTGTVNWDVLYLIGSLAIAEAFFVWWLADQFKKNRHDMNNALMGAVAPLRDEVDDLKERLIRVETILNGKH